MIIRRLSFIATNRCFYNRFLKDYNRIHSRFGGTRGSFKLENGNYIQSKVPLKVIVRSGFFTVFSAYATFTGFVICGYEFWSHLSEKHKNIGKKSIFDQICGTLESFLGRRVRATDIYWVLATLNLLVFIGFNSPYKALFYKYFTNNPYGTIPTLSLLTSLFAHENFLHLFLNMYVLHSFCRGCISLIGVEDFTALFISGGIFSNFTSMLVKSARQSPTVSLGSSGGICAILGAFCMLQPDSRLCVPFVVNIFPHSFRAGDAVWVMFLFELFAVFGFRRSFIDHAAHMGGLLFGISYGLLGVQSSWNRRRDIVAWWRGIRGD